MNNQVHKLIIPIEGMTCNSCVNRIEQALKQVPFVDAVAVHLSNGSALVKGSEQLTPKPLVDAVVSAGYQVPQTQTNMQFSNTATDAQLEKLLHKLSEMKNIVHVEMQKPERQIRLTHLKNSLAMTSIEQLVREIGLTFIVIPDSPSHSLQQRHHHNNINSEQHQHLGELVNHQDTQSRLALLLGQWRLILSLVSAVILSIPMLGMIIGTHIEINGFVQLSLASFVQVFGGYTFYRDSWRALRHGHSTMDTLVTLGTSAAYLLSIVLFLKSPSANIHLYFETSAIVIALVLLGKRLEQKALRKTNQAVKSLMNLWPQQAYLVQDGQLIATSPDKLQPGDLVRVRPFERIPADGLLKSLEASIDESSITGESNPVIRKSGQQVVGGSTNMGDMIEIQVTHSKNHGFLARMIAYVEQAQMEKPPIQRLVDKISAIFVPLVLGVATVTFAIWYLTGHQFAEASLHAIAVLVIACPCALGLATPTALTAGLGIAARNGILIKNAASLEQAKKIKGIIFDKTGTLTLGKPTLTHIITNEPEQAMMQKIYAVQRHSTHPLAQAVIDWGQQHLTDTNTIETPNVQVKIGLGLVGDFGSSRFILGTEQLMKEYGVKLDSLSQEALKLEQDGHTVSWFAQIAPISKLYGIMAFIDQLRPNALETVQKLKSKGFKISLLSGDNTSIVQATSQKLGIEHARGRVLPQDKAEILTQLRQQWGAIAMVGDGVNDAPALAKADLSIAMSGASDVAINTADITLLNNNPALVVSVLDLAVLTEKKIWQNLFWAFIYNIIGIILAAIGFLSPTFAGMAMAFSSVSVITNALFLYRWKPGK